MKKLFPLFLLLTGCSHITSTATIASVEDTAQHNVEVLLHPCNGKNIKVTADRLLFRKGHAYFVLFIPVHSGSAFDRGPTISVDYGYTSKTCSVNDIAASVNNKIINPTTASYLSSHACRYSWNEWNVLPTDKHSLTFSINKESSCKIPPIIIEYDYQTDYIYDRLAG